MYFNYLVGTTRLKNMHIELPCWGYGLLPHNDLQSGFDHLESDIGGYPDD